MSQASASEEFGRLPTTHRSDIERVPISRRSRRWASRTRTTWALSRSGLLRFISPDARGKGPVRRDSFRLRHNRCLGIYGQVLGRTTQRRNPPAETPS